MKKVTMQSKLKDGTVYTVKGIVENYIYNYKHNVIGYSVKYAEDKMKECMFENYKVVEESEYNPL